MEENKQQDITVQITFSSEDLQNMREKFEINNKEDLYNAIWECVNTYLEI